MTAVVRVQLVECAICLALLCEPITTPCGHSFCRPCLVSTLRKNKKKCPSCRSVCEVAGSGRAAGRNRVLHPLATPPAPTPQLARTQPACICYASMCPCASERGPSSPSCCLVPVCLHVTDGRHLTDGRHVTERQVTDPPLGRRQTRLWACPTFFFEVKWAWCSEEGGLMRLALTWDSGFLQVGLSHRGRDAQRKHHPGQCSPGQVGAILLRSNY